MDSLLGTFHINFQGVVFQLINFSVVFTVLYFFAIKPLTKMLDERTETIDKGLKDADRHAKLVKEAEEVYKTELEKARKEAFEIVQSPKKDAEQKRDTLLSETKAQVEAMLKDGKATLEREKETIIKDAQNQMAHVVIDAAEKAIEDVFTDGGLDKQLVEKRMHDHAIH